MGAQMNLADVYDPDRRHTDHRAMDTARRYRIPHPLPGVRYADGVGAWNAGRAAVSPWIDDDNTESETTP